MSGHRLMNRQMYRRDKIPVGRTKQWEMEKDPDFPKPVKIGGTEFFVESEIDAYIERLMAARDGRA